jgi:hypothetical protein
MAVSRAADRIRGRRRCSERERLRVSPTRHDIYGKGSR